MITAGQARAARALLNWTQGELAKRSGVAERTVRTFEAERSNAYDNTIARLQSTLEEVGVVFLMSEEGVGVLLSTSSGPAASPLVT